MNTGLSIGIPAVLTDDIPEASNVEISMKPKEPLLLLSRLDDGNVGVGEVYVSCLFLVFPLCMYQ
jgi:hypothetical protein